MLEAVDAAADETVRLLDVAWLRDDGEEERHVSLSHDALLPVVAGWEVEDERRTYTRKRVVDTARHDIHGAPLDAPIALHKVEEHGRA